MERAIPAKPSAGWVRLDPTYLEEFSGEGGRQEVNGRQDAEKKKLTCLQTKALDFFSLHPIVGY
jgi:hypothetical protein